MDLREALLDLGTYNERVNERLCDVLKGLDEKTIRKDQGSYYKSILGTAEHILGAELLWLRRFRSLFDYPVLAESELLSAPAEATTARMRESPQNLFALFPETDRLFSAFIKAIKEKDLGARIRYKNSKGEELERLCWHTILHLLNHGTHHRGEISALLDQQGIANDYSGLTLYLK